MTVTCLMRGECVVCAGNCQYSEQRKGTTMDLKTAKDRVEQCFNSDEQRRGAPLINLIKMARQAYADGRESRASDIDVAYENGKLAGKREAEDAGYNRGYSQGVSDANYTSDETFPARAMAFLKTHLQFAELMGKLIGDYRDRDDAPFDDGGPYNEAFHKVRP